MPIDVPAKANKSPLSGNERFVMHDPAAGDLVSVATINAVALYLVSNNMVGGPTLAPLTLTPVVYADNEAPGTVLGTIGNRTPGSTLTVSPSSLYEITDGNVLVTGSSRPTVQGAQYLAITETLLGAPNSPRTSTFPVQVNFGEETANGAPWSPLRFPEMLVNAWFQDYVPEGPVASLPSPLGVRAKTATQTNPTLRPTRVPANGGIEFAASTGQHLTFTHEPDAWALHRWGVVIFRADGATGSIAQTNMLMVNDAASPTNGHWVPRAQFVRATGVVTATYRGGADGDAGTSAGGATTNHVATPAAVASMDGETWHVLVFHRRNGRLYASLDGGAEVAAASNHISGIWNQPSSGGRLGDTAATNPKWAFDCVILGQSELPEITVKKLQAWGMYRVGREADLPSGHLYEDEPPEVTDDDFPTRYEFDEAAWDAVGVSVSSSTKYVNRHGAAVTEGSTVTVFRDDFRVRSVSRSTAGKKAQIWYAPGWNSAVGGDAILQAPQQTPDCYVHDAGAETLSLRLQTGGTNLRTGALMTVNTVGVGRSWAGPRVIEARTRMGEPVVGGLFPGFWSYCLEALMWRTSERIEPDFWEYRGEARSFINGLTLHVHSGAIPSYGNHLATDAPQRELAGTNLVPPNWDPALDAYDGEWHTFRVDISVTTPGTTYLIVDDLEIARYPTPKELLERTYINFSQSYTAARGAADPAEVYDLDIDYCEVRYPTAAVEAWAAPFTARPTISGTTTSGQTLTCDPKLPASITDRDFFWFRDAYPIVDQWQNTYVLTADDVGTQIRCMVKAVGAVDQPEAYTALTATVS